MPQVAFGCRPLISAEGRRGWGLCQSAAKPTESNTATVWRPLVGISCRQSSPPILLRLDRKSTRLNSSHFFPTRRSSDLMTNLQEFRAGTNPRDATSRLRMSTIDFSGGTPRVGFVPISGKTYRVEYSDSLAPAGWNLLSTIFATNSSAIRSEEHTSELQSLFPYTTLFRSHD